MQITMQSLNMNTFYLNIHIVIEILAIIISLIAIGQIVVIRFKIVPGLSENLIDSKVYYLIFKSKCST
jgi:hypothetical protein